MIKSGLRIDFTRYNHEQLFSCLFGVILITPYYENTIVEYDLYFHNKKP
jgi:hypothetical protein